MFTVGIGNIKKWGKRTGVLRNKNFTSYWIATFAYYAGMHMERTVYGLLVYTMTKSAFLLGLATTISTLGDVLNIPGGFVADRMMKKKVLYIAQAVLGGEAILMAVLLWAGLVEYQYVVFLSLIHTMAMQFALPARLALVSEIVGKEEFMNAYSLYYVALNTMTVTAPVIAGILASAASVAAVYFVIGVCHLSFIVPFKATQVQVVVKSHRASIRKDFAELLRFARQSSTIATLIILGCGLTLFAQPATVLNPVFAVDILDVGAVGLGLLVSASGIGSLIGSIFSAFISHFKRKTLLLLGSGVFRGVTLLLFATSNVFYFSLFFMALGGIANGIHTTARSALFQLSATDDMRGRVMSLYTITSELRPVGTLMIGTFAWKFGAPFTMGMFGVVWAAFCAAVAISRPTFRRLKLG